MEVGAPQQGVHLEDRQMTRAEHSLEVLFEWASAQGGGSARLIASQRS
jgi:hypothetical protein